MSQLPSPLAVGALALAVGVIIGVLAARWMWRRSDSSTPSTIAAKDRTDPRQGGERVRSQALEAVAEAVLVVGNDGRILECNAAALTLLDRHRPAVTGVEGSAIRKLVGPSGLEADWEELVAARAPWSGEAHVRLPDGSRRAIEVRLVPIFAPSGELSGMVEVYREASSAAPAAAERFLSALDAFGESGDGDEPGGAAQRELRLLAMGFSDLDRVLRQYELLLPAMRAEDPLTEAIAGLAAETSEVASTADVPRLLVEIPRIMTRLRAQVLRLAGGAATGAGSGPDGRR